MNRQPCLEAVPGKLAFEYCRNQQLAFSVRRGITPRGTSQAAEESLATNHARLMPSPDFSPPNRKSARKAGLRDLSTVMLDRLQEVRGSRVGDGADRARATPQAAGQPASGLKTWPALDLLLAISPKDPCRISAEKETGWGVSAKTKGKLAADHGNGCSS